MQKKTRHENRCYKCVWRHTGGDYLCDFATLAAPLTRGGVSPEACGHFVEGHRIRNAAELEKALKTLGLG
mgnify:FL=1|uniref:Uncharacterized protein n=1 Tax=Myoviridae sp. ctpvf97 TaxID=2825176 RepID=A0A8S5TW62_9CAUD|nr:MAG TPA: hypothetical protein [Myoviridae sp. ctpvf97]